jgi:hypothetical protein
VHVNTGLHCLVWVRLGRTQRSHTKLAVELATMDQPNQLEGPTISVATRTLLLSGCEIQNNHRQPTHTEILCTAPLLGIRIPLTVAITEMEELPDYARDQAVQAAKKAGRSLVVVSAVGGRTN